MLLARALMRSPDGGIGRRAGLKHQWGDPCRFDPGSGYLKQNPNPCRSLIYEGFLFYWCNIGETFCKNTPHLNTPLKQKDVTDKHP